ncbi:MAG: hypothetical protein HQM02_01285 [Magnetococcales bacterium]|nr:hypothetical protein [Magnetococcales bacterium]
MKFALSVAINGPGFNHWLPSQSWKTDTGSRSTNKPVPNNHQTLPAKEYSSMPANFTIDLLAGESMTVAGPGTLDFTIPEIARNTTLAGQATVGNGLTVTGKGLTKGLAVNTTTVAAQAGTGKGLSLGLGLGLGAWGPALLAAAAIGGYVYWRKKQHAPLWPFGRI